MDCLDANTYLCESICTSGEARVCSGPVAIQELGDWWKCYGGWGWRQHTECSSRRPLPSGLTEKMRLSWGRAGIIVRRKEKKVIPTLVLVQTLQEKRGCVSWARGPT